MGVSYTSAVGRDVRRAANSARSLGAGHVLLPLTSLVAVLTIGLAYGGRMHTFNQSPGSTGRPTSARSPMRRISRRRSNPGSATPATVALLPAA